MIKLGKMVLKGANSVHKNSSFCGFKLKTVVFVDLGKNHSFQSKSAKTAVFGQNPQKLHFCLNLQEDNIHGFLCETKDHLPKKVTPIFCVSFY